MTPSRLALALCLVACSSNSTAPPPADGGASLDLPVDTAVDPPSLIDAPDAVDAPIAIDASDPVDVIDVPPAEVFFSSTCALPSQRALTLPTDRAVGTTSGAGQLIAQCASSSGPEHIYALHLDAPTGIQLAVHAPWDPMLYVRRACRDPTSELACSDDVPGDDTDAYLHGMLGAGDYDVIVDGFAGTSGRYELVLDSYTTAPNFDCTTGAALSVGTPLTGDTLSGGALNSVCLGAWGPQRFYRVHVLSGRRAVVTATPMGTPAWSVALRAFDRCGAAYCIGNAVSPAPGAAAVLRVDNHAAVPLDASFSIASTTGFTGGTYAIAVAFESAPTAPSNADCTAALAVSDGTTLADVDLSAAGARLADSCLPAAQGASLFYRLSVPPRATGFVTVTPRGAWNPAIRTPDACGVRHCLGFVNDAGDAQPESLSFVNPSDSASDVLFSVGAVDASNGGRFDLTASVIPPPANLSCAAPTTVAHGDRLAFQNASLATDPSAALACLPSAVGGALWYRAVVPAGLTLTARATPLGTADVVVRLIDGCASRACLASANANGAGVVETASYTNTGTAARDVLIAVGTASGGEFHLTVSIDRVYEESTLATACDDMTDAVAAPGVFFDDTASPAFDLPFPVTFFGQRMTACSMSSNGLFQLFPSTDGAVPSAAYDNQIIPSTTAPNGYVAAMWDDLLPIASTRLLTRAFGTAPARRFVAQWTHLAINRDTRARLTFQVKLFETSGVIEIHHCELTAGLDPARATGASATVGVESPDGTAGRQHSFNDALGLSTTRAMRFTP